MFIRKGPTTFLHQQHHIGRSGKQRGAAILADGSGWRVHVGARVVHASVGLQRAGAAAYRRFADGRSSATA